MLRRKTQRRNYKGKQGKVEERERQLTIIKCVHQDWVMTILKDRPLVRLWINSLTPTRKKKKKIESERKHEHRKGKKTHQKLSHHRLWLDDRRHLRRSDWLLKKWNWKFIRHDVKRMSLKVRLRVSENYQHEPQDRGRMKRKRRRRMKRRRRNKEKVIFKHWKPLPPKHFD